VHTIDELRAHLIQALQHLSHDEQDSERARAIAQIAQVIVRSVHTQCAYLEFLAGSGGVSGERNS
jgi:hypothetical protein